MYKILDLHTGQTIGTYTCPRRARRRAEQLDLAYGAYRYSVVMA